MEQQISDTLTKQRIPDLTLTVNGVDFSINKSHLCEHSEYFANFFTDYPAIDKLDLSDVEDDTYIFIDLMNKINGKNTNVSNLPEFEHMVRMKKSCKYYGVKNDLDTKLDQMADLFDTHNLLNIFDTLVDDDEIKEKFMFKHLFQLEKFDESALIKLYELLMSYRFVIAYQGCVHIYEIKTIVNSDKKVSRTMDFVYKIDICASEQNKYIGTMLMSRDQRYLAIDVKRIDSSYTDVYIHEFETNLTINILGVRTLAFTPDNKEILYVDRTKPGILKKKFFSIEVDVLVSSGVCANAIFSDSGKFLALNYDNRTVIHRYDEEMRLIIELDHFDMFKFIFNDRYLILVKIGMKNFYIDIYETKTWKQVYDKKGNGGNYSLVNIKLINDIVNVTSENGIIETFLKLDPVKGWHEFKCKDPYLINSRTSRFMFTNLMDVFSLTASTIIFSRYEPLNQTSTEIQRIETNITDREHLTYTSPSRSYDQCKAILDLECILKIGKYGK